LFFSTFKNALHKRPCGQETLCSATFLQRNSFKLCSILVYITDRNILPQSENTFTGTNPITLERFIVVSVYAEPIHFIVSPTKIMCGFIKRIL